MAPFRLSRWRFMNCCGHVWGHGDPAALADAGRRHFLKSTAAGVAGLAALGTLKEPAESQVRVFPPPPPAVSRIEGLIDFHQHTRDQIRQMGRETPGRLLMS